jgi:phosphatidylserine decarboxylase
MIKYFIIVIIIIIIIYIYINRSPTYKLDEKNNNIIYSPAFGKIIGINEKGKYIYISIYLSIMDVHIQYIPINGEIIEQKYDITGKFELAYELDKSRYNEKMITIIKPKIEIPNIYVYQIAGKYVRKIETYIKEYPKKVISKQKLGIIKLGSRVDIIIPKDKLILMIKKGDRVEGPNTIIGKYRI